MHPNEIAKIVYQLGLNVHKALGPGLLENVYEECLFYECECYGLDVKRQYPLPVIYGEVKLAIGYRIDLLIDGKFIIEVKAVERLHDVHLAQLLTYLRLSRCKPGFLMNFNTNLFKDGVRRVINGNLD